MGTRTNIAMMSDADERVLPENRPAEPLALLRLFQLVSPALPVGAYAYSQGLEYAVHAGWVADEATASSWLSGVARFGVGTLDLPVLARLYSAWQKGDGDQLRFWNAQLLAARESAELRAEDQHLGQALLRVLGELEVDEAPAWRARACAFATAFALAAVRWRIASADAQHGYLWSWCENQVLAAVKLVPLGQSAGQRLLHELAGDIPAIVARSRQIADADIGLSTFAQSLASARHESQYTRLFRS